MTNTEKGQDPEPLSGGRGPLLSPGRTERPRDSALVLGSSISSKHRGPRASRRGNAKGGPGGPAAHHATGCHGRLSTGLRGSRREPWTSHKGVTVAAFRNSWEPLETSRAIWKEHKGLRFGS